MARKNLNFISLEPNNSLMPKELSSFLETFDVECFLVTNLFMSALLMHHVTFPSVCHTLSLYLARRLSIVVTACPVRRLNSKLVKWIGNGGNRGEILSRARTQTNVANPEKCYICEFFFIASPQVNKGGSSVLPKAQRTQE